MVLRVLPLFQCFSSMWLFYTRSPVWQVMTLLSLWERVERSNWSKTESLVSKYVDWVRFGQFRFGQFRFGQFWVWLVQVWSVQVWSVQVWLVHVWSVQVWSVQVWSVQVWSVQDWSAWDGMVKVKLSALTLEKQTPNSYRKLS